MEDSSLDLFEEEFWSEVKEYAEKVGLPLSYVEDEFIILGELVKM